MNEQSQPAHIQDQGSEPVCPPLDAQLAELIEVVLGLRGGGPAGRPHRRGHMECGSSLLRPAHPALLIVYGGAAWAIGAMFLSVLVAHRWLAAGDRGA